MTLPCKCIGQFFWKIIKLLSWAMLPVIVISSPFLIFTSQCKWSFSSLMGSNFHLHTKKQWRKPADVHKEVTNITMETWPYSHSEHEGIKNIYQRHGLKNKDNQMKPPEMFKAFTHLESVCLDEHFLSSTFKS